MRNTCLLIIAAIAFGCGGGDDDGGTSCEDVNQRICDLACDCTDGDECKIQSGGATITHDSASDCTGFWVTFGCMQEESDQVDYVACSAALDTAECVDTAEGMALEFPAEC